MSGEYARTERARRGLTRLTPRVGAGALAVTQAADVFTTLVALRFVSGLEEANVVAAAAIGALGPVVGLTLVSAVAVGTLVVVTERGVAVVRDLGDEDGSHAEDGSQVLVGVVRLVGYGPMTVLNLVVVFHNAALIGTVCCPG